VTHRIDERVVATALLAHELEQLIGNIPIRQNGDGELLRSRRSDFDDVIPLTSNLREVQQSKTLKLPPRSSQRLDTSLEQLRPGLGVDDAELRRQRLRPHDHRGFRALASKTKLVQTNINVLLRMDTRNQADKAGQPYHKNN